MTSSGRSGPANESSRKAWYSGMPSANQARARGVGGGGQPPFPGWEGKAAYPDFTFDRFVPYLQRGLWPLLVSVVAGMVIVLPAGIIIMIAAMGRGCTELTKRFVAETDRILRQTS